MSKKPRGEGRRKKGLTPDRIIATPEGKDPTSSLYRANPICRLPRQPPPRHHAEDATEITFPLHQPFIPRLGWEEKPSLALAAFQLGQLGVSMWVWADVLWDLLARRSQGHFWHPGAKFGVPDTVARLLSARRVLVDLIPPTISGELKSIIDWFAAFNQELIEKADSGSFNFADHNGVVAPWEGKSDELRFWCDRALPKSHSLRPIFELGVAFGEFDLLASGYYSLLIGTPKPEVRESGCRDSIDAIDDFEPLPDLVPLPEIGELARRANSTQEAILARSPLLTSLAGIGRDYDRLGHPDALIRYFEENRECWTHASTKNRSNRKGPRTVPWYGPDGELLCHVPSNDDQILDFEDPLAISMMATEQARRVEVDLAKIPDDFFEIAVEIEEAPVSEVVEPPRVRWDQGELSIDGMFCFRLAPQARNLRAILAAFEEKKWAVDKLDNRLISLGSREPNSFSKATGALTEKGNGRIHFYVDLNRVCWRLTGNLQKFQENEPERPLKTQR
jgi:hypothetical protein